MSIHSVVYTKPNCPKCRMTENKLGDAMFVKEEPMFNGNEEWSQRKIEKFREQSYGSFPVVRIYSDETGERLDEWSDFRMDLIQKWEKAAQESVEAV